MVPYIGKCRTLEYYQIMQTCEEFCVHGDIMFVWKFEIPSHVDIYFAASEMFVQEERIAR